MNHRIGIATQAGKGILMTINIEPAMEARLNQNNPEILVDIEIIGTAFKNV